MEGLKNTTDALTLFLMSIEVKIISAEQSGSKFDSGNHFSDFIKGNFNDIMIPLLKSVKDYTQEFIEAPGTSELSPKSALQCLAACFIIRQKEIKEDFINSSFPKSQANIFSIELALGIYSDLVDELCFMANKCPTLDSTVTLPVGDLSSRKAEINLEKSIHSPTLNKPTPQQALNKPTLNTEIYEGSYDSSAVAPKYRKETITKDTQTSKDKVDKPLSGLFNHLRFCGLIFLLTFSFCLFADFLAYNHFGALLIAILSFFSAFLCVL